MASTSKSPRKVLLMAYQVGQGTLRPYTHHFSPKKFTQPQLFFTLKHGYMRILDFNVIAGVDRVYLLVPEAQEYFS